MALSTAAHAHPLRLRCKKVTADNIVCRTIASDGEVVRDFDILLMKVSIYTLLPTAKTEAAGTYIFKAPPAAYAVIALGDKAHVASLPSVDICQPIDRPADATDRSKLCRLSALTSSSLQPCAPVGSRCRFETLKER
jgi:hypothetical protein